MRKSLLVIVAALLAVAVTASVALAAVNVKSFPTATFSGAHGHPDRWQLQWAGECPGDRHQATAGVATYDCTNPQGHPSPGQNPVPAQPGPADQDLGNADHNGRGTISNLSATVRPADALGTGGWMRGRGSTQWTVVNV